MKLVKLSLVAALAAGAFSTASAVALEEAIKGVDISGTAWARYQNFKEKNGDGNAHWKYKAVVNTKVTIDDNFFFLAGFQYGPDADQRDTEGFTTQGFDVTQALLGYSIGNTTFMVGRYEIGAFFTDDMLGNGIKVVNTDVQGLVLAALWADHLQADSDVLGVVPGPDKDVNAADAVAGVVDALSQNLYGVAAIGAYDPVAFQIWYATLEDVASLFAVEAALNFNVTDSLSLGLKGQYAFADVDSKIKNALPVEDSNFYAVEASTAVAGFDLSAGFVQYKAKGTGNISLSSLEDNGKFIVAGEQLVNNSTSFGSNYHAYAGKNNYWFVTAGYAIPNTGVSFGVDYLQGKFGGVGTDERVKGKEVVARLGYKHNSKLSFSSWYSFVENKFPGDDEKDKFKTFRVQATYKF